ADTVVAFGSFLAARGEATLAGSFLATWLGNVLGALMMYAVARRLGADWMHARLRKFGSEKYEHRLQRLHGRYGMLAIFLSRFLPGVRGIVPPFAGALKMRALPVAVAIVVASAVWYGLITYLAYRVGSSWETLQERIAGTSKWVAIGVSAVVVALVIGWWVHRRTARQPS
ncbi:MAG TPA: DedA family protein, partial [Gemmatimonadaceae bacterium]|nr:DedA family protein [Gemmatimonadaceae bacterium]